MALPEMARTRFRFIDNFPMDATAICRCNRRMIKLGWFLFCPGRRWYNWYLHFKR